MALSFFTPNRTVLLTSDDALYIYASSSRGVRLVETVPWDAENFESNVARIISRDCRGKPVLILNDMVEQHYRKENLLRARVGILDKAGMLKRKLNIAFPNYPVKAAYPLKEKAPKGQAADMYIFAAVPSSSQFVQSASAVKQSLASIAGFCLLPIESSDLVKTLSGKLTGAKKSKWVVFIGQHRSGGLRQIVVKDGELALTRMTPMGEGAQDDSSWAAEVHQEFKATMSYLSRFGYQPEDGLDVIAVAKPSASDALQVLIQEDCNYNALTVPEAARALNLSVGRHDEIHYADLLHIAWTARKAKFILPMRAIQIDELSKPRKAAMAASVLLLAGSAFLGYQLLGQYQAISEINSDLESSGKQYAQLDVQYQKEVQRKEDLGINIKLIQSSIAVKGFLDKERVEPLVLFSGIGRALGKDLRIDKIQIEKPDSGALQSFLQEKESRVPLFEATMQLTYPSTTGIDRGNREVRDLQKRMQDIMPDHKVEVTKFLKDYEYVEEIVVESGDLEKQDIEQDFVAEITITGMQVYD